MIVFFFTRIFVEIFRFVPFWLVYIISDIIRFILFDIFKYRKNVISRNLSLSFPEKSEKELKKISNEFYKNFTDILLEAIKGFTMSEKELLKRYKVLNAHVLDKYYDKGQSVISLAGHYTNWEWGIIIGKKTKHLAGTIYKPLTNKYLNNYLKGKRERFGMKLISTKQTRRVFSNIKEPVSVLLIADQIPSPDTFRKAIWVNFLGQDTPCIHGPEAYSKKMNMPTVFYKYHRIKRGFYTLEIVELNDNPNDVEDGVITKLYMGMLEEVIRENPANWLWSHKRWKLKMENDKIVPNSIY